MSENMPNSDEKSVPSTFPVRTNGATFSEQSMKTVPEGTFIGLHVGPLPAPETLAAYENLCPGAAREILNMAKDNQKHRHKTESKTLDMAFEHQKSVFRFGTRGQFVGAGLAVLYLVAIVIVASWGLENAVMVGLGAAAFAGLSRMMSILVHKNGNVSAKPDKD